MKRKSYKGSLTIEMSLQIPIVLFLFVGIVMSLFYYHDKNILNGAAHETVEWGSEAIREYPEMEEEELISFCKERLKRKCIFLTSYTIQSEIQKEEIRIEITAVKKGYKASVDKRARITEPEKHIRNIRRIEIKSGTKNNN